MITFRPCGGLGNLLFQHHAAYSFARDNKLKLSALGRYPEKRICIADYYKLFSHVTILDSIGSIDYQEPSLKYSTIPSNARNIQGYFQSWKYFDKYRIEIRDLLRNNEKELFETQQNKYNDISQGKKTVCVHIRRGDYLESPGTYPLMDESYYETAMSHFASHRFIVFCEDMHLVNHWDVWKKYDVHIVDEPSALGTFFLMSCCDHFIIANSSLSLAAYYGRTNEDALLIVPKHWYVPGNGIQYRLEEMCDRIFLKL